MATYCINPPVHSTLVSTELVTFTEHTVFVAVLDVEILKIHQFIEAKIQLSGKNSPH